MLARLLWLAAAPLLFSANSRSADLDKILTGDFTQGGAAPTSLRLVDWNVDRGEHLDQIGNSLERDRPDLCSLQEVDLDARRSHGVNVTEELARRLKLRYVWAPAWQELSQRGPAAQPALQGQAILSRLPIRRTRVIRFEHQSTFWQPKALVPNWPMFQRRLGGRIALVVEFDFAGRTLVVYDPHLESRSGGRLQDQQMDEILADARRYPSRTPLILAGDLNTKYNARSMGQRLRAAGWQTAFGARHPRTHSIIFSLDWIATRGPLRIEQPRVEKNRPGSDHLPVSALVSLAQ